MTIIENTGQSLDFKHSYIVTASSILLFDNYLQYKNAIDEINKIEFLEGQELEYDIQRDEFYAASKIG